MVAKSFQNLKILGEPFEKNGRMYVSVQTKTGTTRIVRWYTDYEYSKMYPNETAPAAKVYRTQKEVLGFTNGYITLCLDTEYEQKDWFKDKGARYHKFWGWYFISDTEIPSGIPENVRLARLEWDVVGNEDEKLKSDSEVIAAMDQILYEPNGSEFVGEIGEKLELFVTVEKAIHLDGYYGSSTMHIMHDDCGNVYVWNTASKTWAEGSERHIIGTVKDHSTYHGTNQTILTRCREVV